ncbi:unnamed protein product [Paramecium sonneborni]|uniref:H-type lectin domain-containing protein n=1 Tax=Paramecium sonneborni TaxID=65129 RepID=A0A8S1P849_9CILI|nr:unnamed protein product [Paramecium sonneborni]
MKQITLVVFVFLCLGLVQGQGQFESGNQIIMYASEDHILKISQNVPRELSVNVRFQKVFNNIPQVFISSQVFDCGSGSPNGFSIDVSQVTKEGFVLTGIALSPQPLYQLQVDWYAFDDQRIKVLEYEQENIQKMAEPGDQITTFQLYPNMVSQPNFGIISLIGVKHFYEPNLELKIENLSQNQVSVSARKFGNSQLLYGTSGALWAASPQEFIFDSNHPFQNRPLEAAEVISSNELPQQITQGTRNIPIVATRGYDLEKTTNLRLKYINVVLGAKLEYKFQTWWDTKFYKLYHQAAVYIPPSQNTQQNVVKSSASLNVFNIVNKVQYAHTTTSANQNTLTANKFIPNPQVTSIMKSIGPASQINNAISNVLNRRTFLSQTSNNEEDDLNILSRN